MRKRNLKKIGIFGSSFNPLHIGHVNLLIQAQEAFQFDVLKVIPVFQNPIAPPIVHPSAKLRLDIVRKVFQKAYPYIEVDSREVDREGKSYTIDTIESLSQKNTELFLIMGMDQWMSFHHWKNYKKILKKANLLVCSRPGHRQFKIPSPLKNQVLSKKEITLQNVQKIQLISKKQLCFLKLNDMDISSSQIRKRRSQNFSIQHLVPSAVHQWIQKFKLYQLSDLQIEDSIEHIQFCVRFLEEKKAVQIKVFDLRKLFAQPFDFTVLASGLNTRHTQVLAQELQKQIKKKFSVKAFHVEGKENGEWIVLDYGLWAMHLFYNYTRESYRIEDLWKKAPILVF